MFLIDVQHSLIVPKIWFARRELPVMFRVLSHGIVRASYTAPKWLAEELSWVGTVD